MGRMYSVTFAAAAVTTALDYFQIEPAADQPVRVHYIEFGQTTDLADADAEGLNVIFRNRSTTAITTDESVIYEEVGAPAFGGVAKANETEITTGSPVIIYRAAWNIALPFIFMPTPEIRPWIRGGDLFTVNVSLPADSITVSGCVIFEEIG